MAQLNITLDTELLHGLFTKDTKVEKSAKRYWGKAKESYHEIKSYKQQR